VKFVWRLTPHNQLLYNYSLLDFHLIRMSSQQNDLRIVRKRAVATAFVTMVRHREEEILVLGEEFFQQDPFDHLEFTKENFQLLEIENTEKFIIEKCISFTPPELDTVFHIPFTVKVLYLCIERWRSFNPQNYSFCESILSYLDHSTQRNVDNIDLSFYWLNGLPRLIKCFKECYKDIDQAYLSIPKDSRQTQYEKIVLLLKQNREVILEVSKTISNTKELEQFLNNIVICFLEKGDEQSLLSLMEDAVKEEVEQTLQPQVLFRANTSITKLTRCILNCCGQPFLKLLIGDFITAVLKNPINFEIEFVSDDDKLKKNIENLQKVTDEFLIHLLYQTVDETYSIFKYYCRYLYDAVRQKFPDFGYRAIGGFIFLRLICPALVNPIEYGLCQDESELTGDVKRYLMLISRLWQNIANEVQVFKASYMEPFQSHMDRWVSTIHQYYDLLLENPSESKSKPSYEFDVDELSEARLHIYQLFSTHLDQLSGVLPPKFHEELSAILDVLRNVDRNLYSMPTYFPAVARLSSSSSSVDSDIGNHNLPLDFCSHLHAILCRLYFRLMDNVVLIMERILNRSLFDVQRKTLLKSFVGNNVISSSHVPATSSSVASGTSSSLKPDVEIVAILDHFYDMMKSHYVDSQVINHFFESIAYRIDDIISTKLLRTRYTKQKLFDIKFLSGNLDKWFFGKPIHSFRMNMKDHHGKLFSYSNQIFTALLLESKDLKALKEICPLLSEDQVKAILEKNAEIKQVTQMDLKKITSYKTGKLQQKNLFDVDVEKNAIFDDIKLPLYFQRKELSFLFSQNYKKDNSRNNKMQ